MICARCLLATTERRRGRSFLGALVTAFRVTGGVLVLWFAFYSLGRVLVHIPSRLDPEEFVNRVFSNP
jgi:small neutral amino acid transporter SnatA (MarC family)